MNEEKDSIPNRNEIGPTTAVAEDRRSFTHPNDRSADDHFPLPTSPGVPPMYAEFLTNHEIKKLFTGGNADLGGE